MSIAHIHDDHSSLHSDRHTLPQEPTSLENRVKQALAAHTEFSSDSILTQDNRVKYAGQRQDDMADAHLNEVFHLMRQLNEAGIDSAELGQITREGLNFRQALENTCRRIAQQLDGAPLVYVELGPEPIKTSFILKSLKGHGVDIQRYIAVDINPKSAAPMREVVTKLLPDAEQSYLTAAFEDVRLDDILAADSPIALITMLGFQEGNDDPRVVNNWLSKIARSADGDRPGDLLLSETQLRTTAQLEKISQFYADPAMQRFSRIAFERAIDRNAPTLNRFFLLPVTFSGDQTALVAILAEEFVHTTYGRSLLVSNFCLKLTLDQYRSYRHADGYFDILCESTTDDGTLHFQLSCRR